MNDIDPSIWGPSIGRRQLCVDTSAIFAYFYPADAYHEDARAFFAWLRDHPSVPWRMFLNDYVIDELCSLLARKSNPQTSIRALQHLRRSDALAVYRVPDDVFEAACDSFCAFDDQTISFTDHVVAAHATHRDASVYTFDVDDFQSLGADVIPRRPDIHSGNNDGS